MIKLNKLFHSKVQFINRIFLILELFDFQNSFFYQQINQMGKKKNSDFVQISRFIPVLVMFLGSLSSEEDFSECGKNDFSSSKFIAGATNDLGKTFNQKQIITPVKCFIVYPLSNGYSRANLASVG